MPTYLYRRVSTSAQEDSGAGLKAQLDGMQQFAAAQNLGPAVAIFDDVDCREIGPHERPGLGALLQIVKKGDTILTFKWDRIGTIAEIVLLADRTLKPKGVRIRAVHGDVEDTPEGILMRNILGCFSDFELQQTRGRTKAALKAKKERGEKYCARRYGYAVVEGPLTKEGRQTYRFIEDPKEHRIIERIRSASLFQSANSIAKELNAEGVPGPLGGRWNHRTIQRLAAR